MQDQKLVKDKLKKYNQEHILNYIENNQNEELIKQIIDIDLDKITKLYKNTSVKKDIQLNKISPIDFIDKEKISDKEKYIKIAEKLIKNEQYAVITMAGGQGTRLGFNGPKGTYKLKNGKYIFQILAENIKKAKEQYGVFPYWYIMTSYENNEQTINFFEEKDYFGYDKNKIKFFKQGELPILTSEGKIIIEDEKIKMASNGNGSVYLSLKKSNMLEDMKNNNVKWVYIFGVDNILVNPIDPIFLGLTIDSGKQIASKSVVKKYPEERVGAFCLRNGKPGIIEYIELSEEMKNARNKNGELLYGEANIISHLLSTQILEKISNEELEYHVAIKNNLYKFESFIFDGFKYADDMLVMRVNREEEFAPIKNKEGIDSPDTALELYERKMVKIGSN